MTDAQAQGGNPPPPPSNTGHAIKVTKNGADPDPAICRPGRPVVWWTDENEDFKIEFKSENPCEQNHVENRGRFSDGQLKGGLQNAKQYEYTIRFRGGTVIDPNIDIRF